MYRQRKELLWLLMILLGAALLFCGAASGRAEVTIVLDAGHGGEDRGITGTDGTTEKDVDLDLALRVQRLIDEKLGYRTVLTREKDERITLDDRAANANNNKGSLMVSLHLGGSLDPDLQGYGIYYFRSDGDDHVPEEKGELLLWRRQQAPYVEESSRLAEVLHQAFQNAYPSRRDLGVHALPLYLARSVQMPAVFIESAVLTNKDEEAYLKSETNRQKVAETIFEGLRRYLQTAAGADEEVKQ
jgi:N-acetylmuramoyl-L-alanine amidase